MERDRERRAPLARIHGGIGSDIGMSAQASPVEKQGADCKSRTAAVAQPMAT